MKRETRSRLVPLAIGLALLGAAAHAGQPKRITLKQGGRTVVYYRLADKQYRSVPGRALNETPAATRICVEGKLSFVAANELRLHGPAFAEVTFQLSPDVRLNANPGANLWLGGRIQKEGGRSVFQVEALAELPDDLALFQERWDILEKNKNATPEDYYRLGWWIATCEDLVTGVSARVFERYREKAVQAYRRGLVMEAANLADADDERLAAIVGRFRKLVKTTAGAMLQGQPQWHVSHYRQFLHTHAAAVKQLESGKPLPEKVRKRMQAALYLLLGRMHQRYLEDEAAATKAFLAGVRFSPGDPDLGEALRAAGFVRVADRWVSEAEAKRLAREREGEQQAAAVRRKREEAEREQAEARAKLLAGEGMEKSITIVDSLLSKPNEENVSELGKLMNALPEDVARRALWKAASLPQRALVLGLATSSLEAKAPAVRKDAIDLLLARGATGDRAAAVAHLKTEPSATVGRHTVLALQKIPGNDAIPAMILVLEMSAIPKKLRTLTAKLLAIETGKNFGLDAFSWKQWWKQHKATFKRPEL